VFSFSLSFNVIMINSEVLTSITLKLKVEVDNRGSDIGAVLKSKEDRMQQRSETCTTQGRKNV